MENYDRYKELTDESAKAAGTADKKYESYMDSMEAATKRLTNAWEEFTLKLNSSSIMRGFTNILADVVGNLDKILTLTRALLPLFFSNKIKPFLWNTGAKIGEFFGGAKGDGTKPNILSRFGTQRATYTRDAQGNLVANLGGKQDVVKSGFGQIHNDLEKLIGLTAGKNGIAQKIMGKGGTFSVGDNVNAEWNSKTQRWNYRDAKTGQHVAKDSLTDEQKNIELPDMQQISRGGGWGIATSKLIQADGTVLKRKGGDWYNKETGKIVNLTDGQKQQVAALDAARKQDWKVGGTTSIVMGLAAGLTQGLQKSYAGGDSAGAGLARLFGADIGNQQVESKGANVAKGVASGIGAAVSMLPPPWNLIGGVISTVGPIIVDFVSTWIHKDELERKERSEQAQKQLDALNNIQSTIEQSADLMSKDVWDTDDYKSFQEYIGSLKSSYSDMEDDFSGATQRFIDEFNSIAEEMGLTVGKIESINDLYDSLVEGDQAERIKAQRAIEIANKQAQREQLYKSQEATNHDYLETINGVDKAKFELLKNVKNGTATSDDLAKYGISQKQADQFMAIFSADSEWFDNLEKAFDGLEENQKALREADVELGILRADIHDFTDDELSELTMDGVMGKVADAMEAQGVDVRNAAGYIKDEYVTSIKAAIRSNSEFSTLLKGDTRTMSELVDAAEKFKKVFGNASYADLKDRLDKGESIKDAAQVGGYTEDELKAIVYAANPEQQRNFANAWNTNIEGAKKLAERFKDLSTAEGLLSTSEVVDKYSKLNDVFQDLADNSKLTADNYVKMIEEYPQLISGVGSLTDLYDKVVNQQAFALGNAMYSRIMSETSVGDQIKKQIKNDTSGIYDDVAKDFEKSGLTLTGLLEKAQEYESAGDTAKAEKLRKVVQDYFKQIPGIEFDNSILEKAIEYQEKLWEKQISNLEEQKEALSKVNEEREKELKLMKAQEQLENARKEKKMVYREGVGFVYEADSTAISEAQKNIEDLDTQKKQDDIQAEIDRLNYFKETMDALKNDQELAALKTNFDSYNEALAKNGETLGNNTEAVLKLADALNNQKISFKMNDDGSMDIILPDGTKQTINSQESIKEQTESQLSTLSEAKDALAEASGKFSAAGAPKEGSKEYDELVSDYNSKLAAYNKAKTALGDKASGSEEYQNIVKGDSDYKEKRESGYLLYSGNITQPGKNAVAAGWGFGNWSHDGLKLIDTAPEGKTGDFDKHPDYTSYKQYLGGNKWSDWQALPKDTNWRNLPDYSIVANEMHRDEYNFVLKGQLKKLFDATTGENASGYAVGTLSKPNSDLAYINELGTEAIITPSGTISALPSKTGIIPADITKNLWGLGKVAPNLVDSLTSLKKQRFETEAKTVTNEEGVYIDRLDMSIYPKEGYNMDEFISQLRAKAALTRQNN